MMIMVNKIKSEVKYAMDDCRNNDIIQTVNNKNRFHPLHSEKKLDFNVMS